VKYDLLIRNGTVVREDRVERADIAVSEEKIVELAPDLPGDARETIDASGLHVFPGVIDPHVHFNEPGRTEWEGFATGSAALAAGGGTLFFDMPLNSSPPVLDAESFDLKFEAAKRSSLTDFALWGGLTPKNLDKIDELADRGVIGFKAFMSDSGIDDFPRADDWTLMLGMQQIAERGLPLAVHAENQELITGRTAWYLTHGPISAINWSCSRNDDGEADAIQRAILFANATGCSLHIVHVSSGHCVDVAAARRGTAQVSIETCPHYVFLTSEHVRELGSIAKCAPPIRDRSAGDALWDRVIDGSVDIIASDHSPAPPEMKQKPDFFAAWGGVAGVQSLLPILLTREPRLPAPRVADVTSTRASHRFRVARKGMIQPGNDADLAIVDVDATYELKREMLLDRHKLSPYVGRTFRGVVRRTILRGRTIFLDGKVVGPPAGRFVRPAR
jgi:allantoinase